MGAEIFQQFGFSDPIVLMMKQYAGHAGCGLSIPGYFLGQFISNLMFSNFISKITFNKQKTLQDKLNALRYEQQQGMTREQIDHLHKMSDLGMEQQMVLARQAWDNRKKVSEFQHFCKCVWETNFRIPIDSLLAEYQNLPTDEKRIHVLMAQTKFFASKPGIVNMAQKNYREFVNYVKHGPMLNLPLDTTYMQAWEKTSESLIADSLNLFYIMQGIPTMAIFPTLKDDAVSIEYALWGQAIGNQNLTVNKMADIPLAEASQARMAEVVTAVSALASDNYKTLLLHRSPDCVGLLESNLKDEYAWDFVRPHYAALAEILTTLGMTEAAEMIGNHVNISLQK